LIAISSQEKRFTCQQSGHCCCDHEIIVTLTYRDIFRLYTALENNFQKLLQQISFYKLDKSTQLLIREQMVLTPIQTSQGNIIPGLRKREDDSCIFYFQPNCSIYLHRPLACKNYPLAFIKEKKEFSCVWAKKSLKSCPGIGKGPIIELNEIKKQAIEYFKEINSHNHVVDELNIEAKKGKPLTARECLWVLLAYGEKENQL
jgi:Fe-S-cluster containining protein